MKLIKKPIFTFILGIVIAGSIGVFASQIAASNIIYNNTTVDQALNDLYDKGSKYNTFTVPLTLQGWTVNAENFTVVSPSNYKNKYNTMKIQLQGSNNSTCTATFYDQSWSNPITVVYDQEYPTNSTDYSQLSLGNKPSVAAGYCQFKLIFLNTN